MSFKDSLIKDADMTERRLSSLLGEKSEYGVKKLNDAIAYSLLDGGKRLRAYMVLEFCKLCGGEEKAALDYAAAIEMIHAFSLIHDDLPAMDNDDMRRGKPSNHKAFGEATAILAGDSLALDAFSVICGNKNCTPEQNAEAAMLLSQKAGSLGMCAGQQIDMESEGRKITLGELGELVDLKTGALFSCACRLGCIAGNGSEEQKGAAEIFGLYTGQAFQITDDLLDINSTPEELGKTVGKDEKSEKSTFPALIGEENARRCARQCVSGAKECLDSFPDSESKENLAEFCDYILIRRK